MSDNTGEWVECVCDHEYEIFSEFPYPIRRKGSDRVIAESVNHHGYAYCKLNGKYYQKHRIIALQFIPNPYNLPQVDHVNHIKTDNRKENLRWVSASENNKNKTGRGRYRYNFYDELPSTAVPLNDYNGHTFDSLFIDFQRQRVILFNGVNYRDLAATFHRDYIYYRARDKDNQRCHINHNVLFNNSDE